MGGGGTGLGAEETFQYIGEETQSAPVGIQDGLPEGGEIQQSGTVFRLMLSVFVENKAAVFAVGFLIFMIGFCWIGPLLYHSNQTNAAAAGNFVNLPPQKGFPLGTDSAGFDILGRLMYGGQISMEVGFAAALLSSLVGTTWGVIAGFFSGATDSVMMRIVDVMLSIPALYLLIAVSTIVPKTATMYILILGLLSWLVASRLMRGETLTLKTRDFVQAVRSMGGTRKRMMFRHIVPNSVGTIAVYTTFAVSDNIIALASLSFIGLGVQSPQTDWGGMLYTGSQYIFDGYWWQVFPVCIVLTAVVMSVNFIGDAMRDAFEVRLQRR